MKIITTNKKADINIIKMSQCCCTTGLDFNEACDALHSFILLATRSYDLAYIVAYLHENFIVIKINKKRDTLPR